MQTPNIDALAARGTRFSNAFAQNPVCGPSRCSFMTGWYPHVRGHRTLTHLLKSDEPNLLKLMKTAGYHVAWAGRRGDTFAPVEDHLVLSSHWHARLTVSEMAGRLERGEAA